MTQSLLKWYGVDNNYILLSTFFASLFISVLIMRVIYTTTNTAGVYANVETNVSIRALMFTKGIALLLGILSICLIGRSEVATAGSLYFTVDAVNKGVWSVARMGAGIVGQFSVFLFDAHPAFRWATLFFFLVSLTGDMISQNVYVREMWCITEEICVFDQVQLDLLNIWCWREVVSIFLGIIGFVLSVWLIAIQGACSDKLFFPRKEHRNMAKKLDEVVGKGGVQNLRLRNFKHLGSSD